uniref:Putative head tail connector protein n=1 Tax=viral metagenome TaxID=1070528 RepID=A0A6M3IT09_9ZZZZ
MPNEGYILLKDRPALQRVIDHMKRSKEGRSQHLKDWRNDFKLYHGHIDMSQRDKRRSNQFIPLCFPLVEAAVARYIIGIFGVDPIISVLPQGDDDREGAYFHQLCLQYNLERAGIFLPMSEVARIMLMFGDGFVVPRWRTEWRTTTKQEPQEFMGINIGSVEQEVTEKIYDSMWYDVYTPMQVHPDSGTSVDTCRAIVIEDFHTYDDLLDKQSQGLLFDIDNIDDVSGGTNSGETDGDPRIFYKDCGYDSPEGQEGEVRVWKYFADDHWLWVAEGRTLILDQPNPHNHGKKPIVHFPKTPQQKRFFSKSAIRPVARLQHAYNTIFDQIMDRNTQTLFPWILLRDDAQIDSSRLVSSPNNVIRTQGNPRDAIYTHEIPQLTGDPLRMLELIKAAFDEATGYFGYQRGNEEQRRTASEAYLLAQGGDQRIRLDLMTYESFGMNRLAELSGADIMQFMSDETRVRLLGQQGAARFMSVSPADIRGQFDYRFTGSTAAYNREVDRAQLIEMWNLLANFPEINRRGFAEVLIDSVNSTRSSKEKILAQPQMAPAMGGLGQPGAPPMALPGGAPQPQSPNPGQPVSQTGTVANRQTTGKVSSPGQVIQSMQPRYRAPVAA